MQQMQLCQDKSICMLWTTLFITILTQNHCDLFQNPFVSRLQLASQVLSLHLVKGLFSGAFTPGDSP